MNFYRSLPIIAAAAMLSFGAAHAQDKAQTCDAAAAAYQALAANSTDPDVQEENANVQAAISDCKQGKVDDGIAKINTSMARVHDGVKTPK